MGGRIRWSGGSAALRTALEPLLREGGCPGATLLRQRRRRRHWRVELPGTGPVFVKELRPPSALARLWAPLGPSAARREWRWLCRLHDRGCAVPEPVALARARGGAALLATRWIEGAPLHDAVPRDHPGRRRLLAQLGAALRRLHLCGVVHRDLHAGNVLVTARGPVLLDLRSARRRRSRSARRRDLAWLEHSLARRLGRADRLRLRRAALGGGAPGAPSRRALAAVEIAARRRGRRHARRRTRQSTRAGERSAALVLGTARGLRLRELGPEALRQALASHRAGTALVKRGRRARVSAVRAGGRPVIVKEFSRSGPLRRLADAWRGSPGRRAWLGGHGLRLRGIDAAEPLAFGEERRWGLPVASWVVLEDLRPLRPADALAAQPGQAGAVADALAGLALALHRAGVAHRDLKASHVFLGWPDGRARVRVCDLEGVRFRRRLSERERLRALVELNASLPDALPARLRRRVFTRYARALPFRAGRRRALRRIVARSLARRHRWSGADCALAGSREPDGAYAVMVTQRK